MRWRLPSVVHRNRPFAVGLLLVLLSAEPGAHNPSTRVNELIKALIDGPDASLGYVSPDERIELKRLYGTEREPLWLDGTGRPTADVREARDILEHAADEGLDGAAYHQDVVSRLMACADTATLPSQDQARIDVALSAGILRYLRDLHMGRVDPRAVGFRLGATRDRHDFPVLLRAAISEHRLPALVTEFRPPVVQYALLRSMLRRYRSLADDPAFVAPRPIVRAIHPGESFPDAGVLFRALTALGDLPGVSPTPDTNRYEGPLVDGVKRFQMRHGLAADGVLGKNTIAAMRVPLSWRVRQIELGLERLRWLPDLGSERLIALNIPMFRLWAWDSIPSDSVPSLGMDVIVGRALRTETPVFAENIREVIFRPYWNVPRSILRNEVLPKIRRDRGYLGREDMEIVRGAGDAAAAVGLTDATLAELERATARVRQRPGPRNALGLIKFDVPNSYDVYMHGTPAQALFASSRRDFSHGCVRVADPVALAEWVLRDRPEWTRDRILAATSGTTTLHVKLPRPVQVILFYTTAAVMPEDGTIRFVDDIYRRDVALDRALESLQRLRRPFG